MVQTLREEMLEAYPTYMAIQLLTLPPSSVQKLFDQLRVDCVCIHAILTRHYLNPRPYVPKSGNLHLAWEYARDPALHDRFVNMLRVSPHVFETILGMIENSSIFQNNSNNPQRPMKIQLAVTLYRMGRFGNGSLVEDIARVAGISEGAVELFTKRVQIALMSLHDIFVCPLTEQEKE